MSPRNLYLIPFLFLVVHRIAAGRNSYELEALCGTHRDLRVSNGTSFEFRSGNETSLSCHATLNVRWETQQAFWVTVTVRRFSFTSSRGAGACTPVQPIRLVSYDGVRSILGPTEFSMRFFSSVQLQYSRVEAFESSELDMTITVEPFEVEERVEWFHRHNYHNVSLEEFCGQKLLENVSDGTVRWTLNVEQPPWKKQPDPKCLSSLNFHATNSSYFVSVGVHEIHLNTDGRAFHARCLSQHPLTIRGLGWVHTVTPACSVPTLMRHSGITTISYNRKEPFNETMFLNMTIRLNAGDYFVSDNQHIEESPSQRDVAPNTSSNE